MAITVFEITKRYKRLIELANKLKFSVEQNSNYMTWIAKNKEKYIVVPFVDDCELPDEKTIKNETLIAVCLDGKITGKIKNETSLEEIEILCEKVEKNIITTQQVQDLWDCIFRKSNLMMMLDLLGNIHEKNNDIYYSEEEKTRTAVITACGPEVYINLISDKLSSNYKSIGKKMFIDKDDTIILQLVSKLYERKSYDEYWYSIHSYQINEMKQHKKGYYSFGFSGRNVTVLIEKNKMHKLLPHLTESPNNGNTYWHIKINTNKDGEFYILKTKKGEDDIVIKDKEGIIIVDKDDIDMKNNNVSKSKRITIRDTGLREVSCKKKRR